MKALEAMGTHGLRYILAVLKKLDDSDAEVRKAAVWCLGTMLPKIYNSKLPECSVDTEVAIKLVAMRLADVDENVRQAAVWAVVNMGELGADASAVVATAKLDARRSIANSAGRVCEVAVEALRALGRAGPAHTETVAAMLDDHDARVRTAALTALAAIGLPTALHAGTVAGMLDDTDTRVRAAASEALGSMGEAASPYQQSLAERLEVPDALGRFSAVEAMFKLEHGERAFGGKLEQGEGAFADVMLQDEDGAVRLAAWRGKANAKLLHFDHLLKDAGYDQ